MYYSFNNLIQNSLCYSQERKKQNRPKMPWFDNDLLKQRELVEKARKKFLRKQNEFNESTFKIEKRIYNRVLVQKKKCILQ